MTFRFLTLLKELLNTNYKLLLHLLRYYVTVY